MDSNPILAPWTPPFAPPSFADAIVAMEGAGRTLGWVGALFSNLAASHGNAALQEVERAMAPKLAAHHSRAASRSEAEATAKSFDAIMALLRRAPRSKPPQWHPNPVQPGRSSRGEAPPMPDRQPRVPSRAA